MTGGASVVHLELGNVRDILLDVRRAKVVASHLYDEVTRHPITNYSYVDVMGPVMMEIPEPTFDMSQVLPARKQWVDLDMQQITPAIGYIKTDMNGIQSGEADLQLSDKDKTKFDSELTDCAASIDRALAYTTQLQQLTVGPTYDNLAIAKLTSQMHKELGTVEKSTKRLIGEIKKSKKK